MSQLVATPRGELHTVAELHAKVRFCLLRGLPVRLAAISERFSSSSLPPSFARGRRTATFPARGTASRGTPLFFLR